MEGPHQPEDRFIAVSVVQQIAHHQIEHHAAHGSAKADQSGNRADNDRAAAVLKRQSPEDLEAVRASLRERISSYEQDGSYAVPATACVITGRKPQ